MAGYRADVDRNIVPRWRSFEDSLRLRELGSARTEAHHRFLTRDFLRQKIADWEDHRTLGHASDAVGAAPEYAKKGKRGPRASTIYIEHSRRRTIVGNQNWQSER